MTESSLILWRLTWIKSWQLQRRERRSASEWDVRRASWRESPRLSKWSRSRRNAKLNRSARLLTERHQAMSHQSYRRSMKSRCARSENSKKLSKTRRRSSCGGTRWCTLPAKLWAIQFNLRWKDNLRRTANWSKSTKPISSTLPTYQLQGEEQTQIHIQR